MAMDRARSAPDGATGRKARPRLSIKHGNTSRGSSSDSDNVGQGTPGSRVSAMDIKRQPKGNRKRNIYIGIGVLAVLVSAFLFSRLEPAAPTIDRNVIVQGTVARGEMVREVRGSGTLVPEHVQFVAAVTAGRVDNNLRSLCQTGQVRMLQIAPVRTHRQVERNTINEKSRRNVVILNVGDQAVSVRIIHNSQIAV